MHRDFTLQLKTNSGVRGERSAGIREQGGGRRVCYWFLLLLSGVTFGSSFSLFSIAARAGQDPLGLAFWYSALSAVLVLAPFLFRRNRHWLRGRVIVFCFLWSLVSTTVPSVLLFHAARELPAGIVALAVALVPMATFAGAIMVKCGRASFRRCCGLAIGGTAALLVILPETSLPDPDDTFWLLLPFGVVLCYAAEHLYYAFRAPEDIPVAGLMFLIFVFSALMLLLVSLLTSTFFLPAWPPSVGEWALFGVASVTVLDYFLFAFLVARAGPVFTSQAAYVVTLAGIGWGMLLFGERHSWWIWVALALLLIGIALVQPEETYEGGS